METRPPPFQPHPRPPSRPHEHQQYAVPPSPYGVDAPRSIPPPPPPPALLQQDPFYRPQRQTFESIAASTPRPETRPASSYPPPPPPPPPFGGPTEHYPRDPRDGALDRREGYGVKRSHDQAMAGEQIENGRSDSRRPQYDLPTAAAAHQHPPPFSHASQSHATGAPPGHHSTSNAPEHHKPGNGSMFQGPPSRSPPPPSPYGARPMLPPGSPQYGQSQQSHHGPQQGPLPPPPFGRGQGTISHRSDMSLASILGGDLPRPNQDPRYQSMNGAPQNGHSHYGERDGQRGGPPYLPSEARSQTPDRYVPRQFEYTRPSRAMSGGEGSLHVSNRSPERYGFGPPLSHAHESDPRNAPPLHPHNSAPGSRRQSIGGAPPAPMSRPQTSVSAVGPEMFHHHFAGPPVDHLGSYRDPRDMHRPPPPPMPPLEEANGQREHSGPEHRFWDQDSTGRPQYREEYGPPPRPNNYPFMPTLAPQAHPSPRSVEAPRSDPAAQSLNGHGPVYGPTAKPAPPPDLEKQSTYDIRKSSVDSLPPGYQPRLESPVQRHKQHIGMDRTNSTRSEYTPTRNHLLNVAAEERRLRNQSPLPQAVQGAQAPAKGPASEPGIKNEFGRMFSGLGGVTPTPTPVELAHKRYSSPADDIPGGGRNTPGPGRLDLGPKRTNSRTSKRRKNRDEGFEGDLESPTGEIPRSVNGKGLKRSRNSYIEGLGIHRGDTGSPFGAGRRVFTPTSFSHHPKRERKPRTVVRSQAVLDSVKDKPRKHLGSMLYQLNVEPGASMVANVGNDNSTDKHGFEIAPTPIPRFEDKANCTFTIRVPREHLTGSARMSVCQRRNLWGTEVYTDDTDPLAAAMHSGWVRGEWPDDIDISLLGIGKDQGRQERLNSNAIGPNGRTGLSVSVSPELSRKNLAPYGNGTAFGNTSGSEQGASRKNSDVGSGAHDDKIDPDILTSVPVYPMIPGSGKDLHITILLLPRLQQYASTVQNGIKSRPWTTQHDGNSFMVHSIQFVDEGEDGRRDERGAGAKHARLRGSGAQPRGTKRKLNSFSRNLNNKKGARVVAAVGA